MTHRILITKTGILLMKTMKKTIWIFFFLWKQSIHSFPFLLNLPLYTLDYQEALCCWHVEAVLHSRASKQLYHLQQSRNQKWVEIERLHGSLIVCLKPKTNCKEVLITDLNLTCLFSIEILVQFFYSLR